MIFGKAGGGGKTINYLDNIHPWQNVYACISPDAILRFVLLEKAWNQTAKVHLASTILLSNQFKFGVSHFCTCIN